MTFTRTTNLYVAGVKLASSIETFDSDGVLEFTGTIGAGDELQITMPVDPASLMAAFISSAQALTVCTNDTKISGNADDTLTVRAGVPLSWVPGDPLDTLFSATVNDFYITNEGAEETTVSLRFLMDVTP